MAGFLLSYLNPLRLDVTSGSPQYDQEQETRLLKTAPHLISATPLITSRPEFSGPSFIPRLKHSPAGIPLGLVVDLIALLSQRNTDVYLSQEH